MIWEASNDALRRTLRGKWRHEALDISSRVGIAEIQRGMLLALGASERRVHPTSDPTG